MTTDQFGITAFYPTKTSGREWFNTWSNGVPRVFQFTGGNYDLPPTSGKNQDPQDYQFIDVGSGPNTWSIDGSSGIAVWEHTFENDGGDCRPTIIDYPSGGVQPYDIATQDPPRLTWQNVEMTLYVRLIALDLTYDTPPDTWSRVIRICGRSNHFNTDNCLCDAKGYDFQLEYSPFDDHLGRISKEIIHDTYTSPSNTSIGLPITHYDHTMGIASYSRFGNVENVPLLRWIGMKLVIRNITSNGQVRLECYRDMLNGLNGGSWVKLFEFDDDGIDGNWGAISGAKRGWLDEAFAEPGGCGVTENPPLSCIEDPTPYHDNYNPIITRAGYACYFRGSGFAKIHFKNFSIREIDPLATP